MAKKQTNLNCIDFYSISSEVRIYPRRSYSVDLNCYKINIYDSNSILDVAIRVAQHVVWGPAVPWSTIVQCASVLKIPAVIRSLLATLTVHLVSYTLEKKKNKQKQI